MYAPAGKFEIYDSETVSDGFKAHTFMGGEKPVKVISPVPPPSK